MGCRCDCEEGVWVLEGRSQYFVIARVGLRWCFLKGGGVGDFFMIEIKLFD